MATIETRTRKDGSRAYRLKWRYGGKRGGSPQSVTYVVVDDAKRMKGAVEALGHLVYDEDPRVVTFELVTGQRPTSYAAPTFGEVAERYVTSRTRANANSRDQYRYLVTSALSALVSQPIEAITDDDIRRVINAITDRGGCATPAYEMARSVFKFAVNKGMLRNGNPMVFVDAPKKRGRTANFLTVDEAQMLLDACRRTGYGAVGEDLANVVEVILGTGLRISEALGLIVADVHVGDLGSAWLDVDRQLSRPTRQEELHRVPPKTEAGQRRVVLDGDTALVLARLVEGKRQDASVFSDPLEGGWWRQYRVNHAWARAREHAQEEMGLTKSPRIHDLRHTHAAWLLTDGVPLLAVSRRLGHESIKVTADVYGHILPEADNTIRDAIAGRRATMTRKTTAFGGRPTNRRTATRTAPSGRRTPQRSTGRKAKTHRASGTAE